MLWYCTLTCFNGFRRLLYVCDWRPTTTGLPEWALTTSSLCWHQRCLRSCTPGRRAAGTTSSLKLGRKWPLYKLIIQKNNGSNCDRVYTANTGCSLLTPICTLWELQHAAGSVPLVSWRTRTWRSFCRKRTWCRLWGTRSPEPPAPPRGPLDTSLWTTAFI